MTVEELTTTLHRSPRIDEIADSIWRDRGRSFRGDGNGEKAIKLYPWIILLRRILMAALSSLLDIFGNVDEGFEKVNQRLVLEKVLHVLGVTAKDDHSTYLFREFKPERSWR